jgi:alkanesulfonate monooxygenase SsuD/methylene tetrahydromethanopterin reductase-like flavin-dependent oxidoreductase (luciferase family)
MAEEAGWDGIFLGDAIWTEDPMIALAAAATATHRIRLGTMVTPVPLRRPWKLAGESTALDHLSDGRLILGLATGAVWMGWHAFPDEITETRARAEMLGETIDILTLFYKREPFDYDGKHYHLKLTHLDPRHYPPKPVQQPRIPLWAVGVWPRKRSMQRVLKCDGVIVETMKDAGEPEPTTPDDVREIKAYVEAHRTLSTPFDIVINGSTAELDAAERREVLQAWQEAGTTWWIEGMWEASEDDVTAHLRQGPPPLD